MHITLLGAHVPSNTSQLVTKFYVNCNINSIQCTISQINKMNENLLSEDNYYYFQFVFHWSTLS